MKSLELSIKTDKGFVEVAEVVPPLDRQWYILSPTLNTGWLSLQLPTSQLIAVPLRPGAVFAIAPDYQGKILAKLGCTGLSTPEKALLVFCDNYEYEEGYNKHINPNPTIDIEVVK